MKKKFLGGTLAILLILSPTTSFAKQSGEQHDAVSLLSDSSSVNRVQEPLKSLYYTTGKSVIRPIEPIEPVKPIDPIPRPEPIQPIKPKPIVPIKPIDPIEPKPIPKPIQPKPKPTPVVPSPPPSKPSPPAKPAEPKPPQREKLEKEDKPQKDSQELAPVISLNNKHPLTKNGGKLPKSTTNQPKWIAAGAATTFIGMCFMVLGLRRNQKDQ